MMEKGRIRKLKRARQKLATKEAWHYSIGCPSLASEETAAIAQLDALLKTLEAKPE